jgi:UDP-glucuronate 4-epimerase
LPLQDGDVTETFANVDHLMATVDFKPKTSIREGVRNFIDWYTDYYGIENK